MARYRLDLERLYRPFNMAVVTRTLNAAATTVLSLGVIRWATMHALDVSIEVDERPELWAHLWCFGGLGALTAVPSFRHLQVNVR